VARLNGVAALYEWAIDAWGYGQAAFWEWTEGRPTARGVRLGNGLMFNRCGLGGLFWRSSAGAGSGKQFRRTFVNGL